MMLSYVQGTAMTRESDAYPFYMGQNYVIMKADSGQRVSFEDIIDIDKDTGVLVISRGINSETIGVYDPDMTMAFENAFTGRGITRYFSHDDYTNKTKSGIIVSSTPENITPEYTSANISEVMYSTDINSSFNYDGYTKEVVNLASLETLGEYVYLDYGDKQSANRIIGLLRDSGYSRQSGDYIGLLESLFSFKGWIGSTMTDGLLIYVFFGVASFWHFYNDRKKITIHFLHGGTLKRMTSNLMGQFVILSLLGMIPVLIFSSLQRGTGYLVMTKSSLLMFLITHILITSLMYLLTFYSVFTMIRNSKRGDNYVR